MAIFKKHKVADKVEARFQQAISLVKDLDKKEFNRMMDGIKLAWEAYDKIRKVQTVDEKEVAEIASTEKELDFIDSKEV